MSPKVVIETIPYVQQRYQTCGDYYFTEYTAEDGITKLTRLDFRVNDLGNEDYEFCVKIHEQVEEHLTRRKGILEPQIKAFDEMWEKEREAGLHREDEEPGDDPRAPYHMEHILAEAIERMILYARGGNWSDYGKAVVASCNVPHPADSKD